MLGPLFMWLRSLLRPEPVRLAVVRRYCDANGAHVGELYLERHGYGYSMVGVSLDTLPLDWQDDCGHAAFRLDTVSDFLAPIGPNILRVGALEPGDNDAVRGMVAALPRRGLELAIQNRFIERVEGTNDRV